MGNDKQTAMEHAFIHPYCTVAAMGLVKQTRDPGIFMAGLQYAITAERRLNLKRFVVTFVCNVFPLCKSAVCRSIRFTGVNISSRYGK